MPSHPCIIGTSALLWSQHKQTALTCCPPLALLWSAAMYLAELLHKVGTVLSYSCRELARKRSTTHN
jgi:hypothetical protein